MYLPSTLPELLQTFDKICFNILILLYDLSPLAYSFTFHKPLPCERLQADARTYTADDCTREWNGVLFQDYGPFKA